MNRKRVFRLLLVAVVTAAIAIGLTYTTKVIAGVQVPYGTIKANATDWQEEPLDPEMCKGSGGGGGCYRILTCAPAIPECGCTDWSEWH